MKNEIIDSIINAEVKADKIVEDAKLKSMQKLEKLEQDFEKSKLEFDNISKRKLNNAIKNVEDKQKNVFEAGLLKYQNEAKELQLSCRKKFDKASRLLLKEVQDGNS